MDRPATTSGMRHVALCVSDLSACEHFYVELMAMTVEWRPDEDNVYLTSGNDNLALHRDKRTFSDWIISGLLLQQPMKSINGMTF